MALQTIKVIKPKPLRWWEHLYLPQILMGLKTTFGIMIRKPVTLKYPEERPIIPKGYRGVPTLVKDQEGREKCVSCQLCEFVCPAKAIRVTPGAVDPASPHAEVVEKAPAAFEINMLRCIYCGLCQEVCPESAIHLQDIYSLNGFSRESLILNKEMLYKIGGTLPDKHLKWSHKATAHHAPASH